MAITSASFPVNLTASGNQQFVGSGFTVKLTIYSFWNNGYSAALEIVNTSSQPMEFNLFVDNS